MATQTTLTPDQFRQSLKDQGVTLKAWAEKHGFHEEYCSRVLCGLVKGNRGKGHKIAVAMGIKANPEQTI